MDAQKKILLPTDFSRCANQALAVASRLVTQFDAELHLLHGIVLHGEEPYDISFHLSNAEATQKKIGSSASEKMDSLLRAYHAGDRPVKKVHQRGIAPAPIILNYAQDHNIDMIIMGTHGRRGLRHFLLGSVAEEVVRLAPCPVLTVRESEKMDRMQTPKRILVPLDFSDSSIQTLSKAKELAGLFDAEIQLLHVIEQSVHPAFYASGKTSIFDFLPEVRSKSEFALQELYGQASGPATPYSCHVLEGHAASNIVDFAHTNDSDFIVIATRGLTGIEHFLLGSVAEKVVRTAVCPVLTIKPDHQKE